MQGRRLPTRKGRALNKEQFPSVKTREGITSVAPSAYVPSAPFSMVVQKAPIASFWQRRRVGNALAIMPNRHVIEKALFRTIEHLNYSSFKVHLDKATLTPTVGEFDTSFVESIRNEKGKPLLHVAAAVLGKHADSRFITSLVEVGVPIY